ncbi:phosphatases II [Cutaneotrichosporon oleaginosum]|uniref:Phosphatases II n=1 Tax=Cutaneotrichosporon oleaginosum TaxID=879819 RepID=A0A0J0XK72_9TREE|nr:phosphatases II [Cutaneotrichosporon oleaginosum]KLT41508.1 phosphatases II [Cutaneotrichosporon oleaginosum]TXT05843.1 hypothetical protein COLE_07163 [Cutaneotrichosporon oleaginosum]
MDGLRVAKVENVVLEGTARSPPHARLRVEGTLHLTPHHLFFSPASQDGVNIEKPRATATDGEIWIPYPTINVLQRLPQSAAGKYPLLVGTKTFDTYTLLFEKWGEGGAEDVWASVRDCAVTQSVEQLYAFFYTLPRSPLASTSSLPASSPSPASLAPVPSPLSPNPLLPPSLSADAPSPGAVSGTSKTAATGWGVYNPRTEFARQGVGSRTRAWRFTDINRDYSFSPTYPAKLVVPTRISDSVLAYAAKYRSKARIPALSYLHWANQASITRSSQPMVGLKGNRSAQDERLVECIFTSHQSPESAGSSQITPSASSSNLAALPAAQVYGATCTNLIIDARPTTNAMANVAKGAGSENMDHYRWAEKAYLGIDNIHVMRNSLKTVVETLAEASAGGMPVDRERLRKSGWLKHLTAILDGSVMIVKNIHINSSHVLIHCSDGWDRTSQLSAVAQLCLDPYYRTLDGFRVLVEKDWLSFGHMFMHRSGHLSSSKLFTATPDNIDAMDDESDDDFGIAVKGAQAFFASMSKQFTSSSHLKEISPVFHQFLDCVRQIQRQFPERFEFNEDYLLDLHYNLYACQFGTFLFDNERQRRVAVSGKPYVERTVSAWEWFDLPAQRASYLNADYKPELDDRSARGPDADMGVLHPDPRDVRFWHRLFKRADEEMNMSEAFREPQPPEALLVAPSSAADPRPNVRVAPRDAAAAHVPPPILPYAPRVVSTPKRPEPIRASSSTGSQTTMPRGKWSWNSVGSGALSAFNTIRSSATDAYTHLRERTDEESPQRELGSFEPGTGIGEARTVRGPLEANPWDDDVAVRTTATSALVPEVAPISGGLVGEGVGVARVRTREEVRNGLPASQSKPARSTTAELAVNPWSDIPRQSLADLTLAEAASALRGEKEVKGTVVNEAPKPDVASAPRGSHAWDPLGAT